jgi:organic hydroperoxide reductase OsmC/OhrA
MSPTSTAPKNKQSKTQQPETNKLALLAACFILAFSSSLKMEATRSSETSGDFQRTTRRYIPVDTRSVTFMTLNLME